MTIKTLVVQLSDADGNDGFFYNTPATTVPEAVAHAYAQHIADWDDPDYEPDPETYDVVRVFPGRIDGQNLVDIDDPKTVKEHIT